MVLPWRLRFVFEDKNYLFPECHIERRCGQSHYNRNAPPINAHRSSYIYTPSVLVRCLIHLKKAQRRPLIRVFPDGLRRGIGSRSPVEPWLPVSAQYRRVEFVLSRYLHRQLEHVRCRESRTTEGTFPGLGGCFLLDGASSTRNAFGNLCQEFIKEFLILFSRS